MRIEQRRVFGSMRITDEEYAAVCGLQMKSMRHPAVRAVTYLRHYAFLPGLPI